MSKKVLLAVLPFLALLLLSPGTARAALNDTCVKAQVYAVTGSWNAGGGATYDNNFGTSDAPPGSAGAYGYMWANYTLGDVDVAQSVWTVKDSTQHDLPFGSNCTIVDGKLVVGAVARAPTGYFAAWWCYNGATWSVMRNDTTNNVVAEECITFFLNENETTTTTALVSSTTTTIEETTVNTTTTVCPTTNNQTNCCPKQWNATETCCVNPWFLLKNKVYWFNNTYISQNETTYCPYGCSEVLKICNLPPIYTWLGVLVLIALILYIIKKLRLI